MLACHAATNAASKIAPLSPATSDIRKGLVELKSDLFGRALRMSRCPAMAEDLVQDTVERAIRFESTYQPGTNLRAWVHQILFSVFMTSCRRGRRERDALNVLSTDPCAWTLPDAVSLEMSELSPPMARALESLPKSFREALVLVDLEEMAYKDAAQRLGVPVGTVMSRLHRGRKMLAEAVRSGQQQGEACAAAA
jgi:RNA polymerase sigma-70 factor (ECF subfamily)